MPKGRHAANGKAGLGADKGGICLAQKLPRQRRALGGINLIAPRCQEQINAVTGLAAKNDGFHDLIDPATRRIGSISRAPRGVVHFLDFQGDSKPFQIGLHAFQAFAHGAILTLDPSGARPVDLRRSQRQSLEMTRLANATKCPIPFHPEAAEELRELYADMPKPLLDLITGTAACSPFLRQLMRREVDWLQAAALLPLDEVVAGIHASVQTTSIDQTGKSLRRAKSRLSLITALADLGGLWTLEDVTATLTRFADFAVETALSVYLRQAFEAGQLPGMSESDLASACGMSVIAMGKMGAFELNYSSDIDLIVLFDDTRLSDENFETIRERFIRITRRMARMLGDVTAEGYVFRTDLRLRPDPSVTSVCLSMGAAERYYESLGRTWERAAFIKARAAAGDIAAGEAFLATLKPFVWRKHLDFAAIEDAHDMRLRIRSHKGLGGPITLPGHNMKLGRGGIREIEFFTQTRQIIAGGRDPDLRLRETVTGLFALAEKGWISKEIAAELADAYKAHRTTEHRIQMIADAQTHDLPGDAEGFLRLANLMGFETTAEFEEDQKSRLERVHHLIESFFTPEQSTATASKHDTTALMDAWAKFPALRNARANEIFRRILPEILTRVDLTAHPDETLNQFQGFLSGLPAGVQLFSLFEANPQLITLLVDICGASPTLARYLSRNANVFDAVLGGTFFETLPGVPALAAALDYRLSAIVDYEAQLNDARRWMKEQHFRIGVQQLKETITSAEAARHYSDLAEAVVQAVLPPVIKAFSQRHGPLPGRGLVVLGMGSLGSACLSATSDLDLIVIYDAAGVEASDGKRALPVQTYFARLTQALVTGLSSPMAEGRLYEVDMRLRPSGRKGPVATSIQSFRNYQLEDAWTWEHLALTRARVVAGDPGLAREVEAFRKDLLARPRDFATILGDVKDMRDRLLAAEDHARAQNPWETKVGAGRMLDLDLCAQAAALLAACPARDTPTQLTTAGAKLGLNDEEIDALSGAWQRLFAVQQVGRLLVENALEPDKIGKDGLALLLHQTMVTTLAGLEETLANERKRSVEIVAGIIGASG